MKKFSIVMMSVAAILMFSAPSFAGSNAVANSGSNSTAVTGNSSAGASAGGQDQSQDTDVNINFPEGKDTINNKGTGYRGFANPADINYPGLPGYFGAATPGSSFQSLKSLLTYKNLFTTDELLKMSKGDYFGSKVIVTPLVNKVEDANKAEIMQLLLAKPVTKNKVTLVGYITVKATGDGTVSPEIMAEAMLAARDLGADTVHVTSEGVERVLKAFGWGIGLATTKATMSADESAGGVASAGTGISGGTAGYKDRPWLQLFALITD